ncbi:MAG: hypothetical protein DCC68_05910 [Planctomycetota bacterium]|nr:MAG: hypothetical protein DCC68_05910 [Planctomycetota bacterium]
MTEPRAVRALKAPRVSGTALVEPPLDSVARLLDANAALPLDRVDLFGRSLADVARIARAQLLADAIRYSRQYRDVSAIPSASPPRVILAGHQPELFHPGVWFKNFVLDRLARRHGAVAVNLVIDNDVCRSASIRVPAGDVDKPRAELVAFDAPGIAVPWEERVIVDGARFRSFADRVVSAVHSLVAEPLVRDLWPHAVAAAERGAALGTALAQARHAYEGDLGLSTLEVPLSSVCRGEAFAWFVAWLLVEAPRVRGVYNVAVQAYRAANRIRSAAHPVPDLAFDGEFCEAPLWIWSRDDPRRRRLFVAGKPDRIVLTDREGFRREIAARLDAPHHVAEQISHLAAQGVRLRPRALTNTWFARLALGHLFVHGIGGAKYDEVTDQIIAGLFGIEPPAYLTATATLRLPIAHASGAAAALETLARRRRDLAYRAEAAIARDDPAWRAVVAQKQACIQEFRAANGRPWNRDMARRLHSAVAAANAALSPWTADDLRALDAEEARLKERVRAEQLLESREYAFCLFPRDAIVPVLGSLADG